MIWEERLLSKNEEMILKRLIIIIILNKNKLEILTQNGKKLIKITDFYKIMESI
jgi:hypothetical protein